MGKGKKKRKGPPLTGLAAALVKAGKLDAKSANKLTREKRREDRKLSPEELAQQEAEKQAEADARRAAEAEASRARQAAQNAAAADSRAQRAVQSGLVRTTGGGGRWFFVSRSGLIPFIEVDRETGHKLKDGQAGIVESQGVVSAAHCIVGAQALMTLHTIDPEFVRFWNR